MKTNQRAMIGSLFAIVLVLGMVATPAGAWSQEVEEVQEPVQKSMENTPCVKVYTDPPGAGFSPTGCLDPVLELIQ